MYANRLLEDVYVEDKNGDKYLDLISGAGVGYLLRYGDKRVGEILSESFAKMPSCTNFLNHESRDILADKLEKLSGLNVALIVCSGSESVEAAVKLSLKRHYELGKTKKNIILFRNGCYFGRTFFTSCASDNKKYHDFLGIRRLGFAGFNSAFEIGSMDLEKVSCIVMESFSSRSLEEITPQEIQYLNKVSAMHDIDLIFDEIKSGCGRTGYFFSYQTYGLRADIVAGSKALAAGLPLTAVMVADKFKDFVDTNWYSSSLGGNPAFCDVAMYLLESSGVCGKPPLSNSLNRELEETMRFIFENKEVDYQIVRVGDWWNVRTNKAGKLAEGLLANGVIVYHIGKDYISLLPNRYFTSSHWDEFFDKLERVKLD